jgi:Zn-dependent protease with chaperone function
MPAALLVLVYALTMAWFAPRILTRLAGHGASARLGLTAWLIAILTALSSAAVALVLLLRAAVAGWPGLARAVCRSVAGGACTPVMYRSALFELALGLLATCVTLAAVTLTWRYGRGIQRARRASHAHATVARMVGRQLPASRFAVVLDRQETAAYCLPGNPATIVLTTGALNVLEPVQLAAVLSHELAHLSGHHHLLTLLTRGLAAAFPAVPLFAAGPAEITQLAEMCADDRAARQVGRQPLATALLALGTGTAVPVHALAATGCATLARVQRLASPPSQARRARCRLGLFSLCAAFLLGWSLVTALAAGLVAHGLTAW